MKLSKRLICLLLSLTVLVSLAAVPVYAAEPLEAGSATYTNPLYPDLSASAPALETAETDNSASLSAPRTQSDSYLTISEAAAELRDQMRARSTNFTIPVYAPGYTSDKPSVIKLVSQVLMPMAYSEELAVGINSGDYLRWSWAKIKYDWSSTSDGHLDLTMSVFYYTSADEEAWLLSQVKHIVDELDLWQVSDYQKYHGIYDYILDHVDYDYDGLNNDGLNSEYHYVYSAYAALHDGKAVCQGYATLFYAMCREMGLPVRIITNKTHAWNIVGLGDLWYNMDSTWDGKTAVSTHDYFLKGSEHFPDHVPSAEYLSETFLTTYPLSADDYTPTILDDQPVCQFRDVSPESYYYDAVLEMANRKLFYGTGSYTFSPDLSVTRAMLIAVLWRLAECPEPNNACVFADVSGTEYFAKSIAWAYEAGIAAGTSDTTFEPNRDLTRQELAAFLYRYAQKMGCNTAAYNSLSKFTDRDSTDGYALPALRWAVGAKIIYGTSDTTLLPHGTASRCQLAAMLYRFISYYNI